MLLGEVLNNVLVNSTVEDAGQLQQCQVREFWLTQLKFDHSPCNPGVVLARLVGLFLTASSKDPMCRPMTLPSPPGRELNSFERLTENQVSSNVEELTINSVLFLMLLDHEFRSSNGDT